MSEPSWKDQCNGDEKLIAHVNSTVVRDEIFPRTPDADDIAIARKQLTASAAQNKMDFANSKDKILPAAPDGLKL